MASGVLLLQGSLLSVGVIYLFLTPTQVCGVTFPQGDYYDYQGEPYCEIHYHAQRGTLCAQCQKPITGKWACLLGELWF